MTAPIVATVKRNWNAIRLAVLVIAAACGGGCSGVNYSRGVSPLDFILPGLMQNQPSPPAETNSLSHSAPMLVRAN
jgi:hypothetical protein